MRDGSLEDDEYLDLPEPIYPNIVNIGKISHETRLDQVLAQIGLKYSDYIWWSSNDKIKCRIPPELY